jgi:hypothetical protein
MPLRSWHEDEYETQADLSADDEATKRETEPLHPTQDIRAKKPDPRFHWGKELPNNSQVILSVPGYEQPLVLNFEESIILGRRDVNTKENVCADLTPFGGYEKGVSRVHASIQRVRGSLVLVDLGSTHGTFLNGQRLSPHQQNMLLEGDEIRLGNWVAVVAPAPAGTR